MAADPPAELTFGRRLAILSTVVLSSTAFVATILISTALLPQMQGALSATQDEISWVMTFNILATAVATPLTGWLASSYGSRTTMVACTAIFTVATLACGEAGSLQSLVFWRIVQGAAGAPIIPLAQTILLNTFPPRQHGVVIAIYGMTNIIGPAIGPMFAGVIAEVLGWRWGFFMVVPFGVIATIGLQLALLADPPKGPVKLDWFGLITLCVAIAASQLVLARGSRLDWFDSGEIVLATFIAVGTFYLFLAHSLTAKAPFLNLRLLLDRNYAIGLVMVTIFGMLNFAPVVLLPSLMQQQAGFPDALVGQFVGWRGVGAAAGFFLAMGMAKLDPRLSLLIGWSLQAISGFWLMSLDLNLDMRTLAINSVLQGISVGVIWVPMTVLTFATLRPEDRAETTAVFHLLRNMGSTFFISVAVAEVVLASGANYARLTEFANPFNKVFFWPFASGAWTMETPQGLAQLSKEMARQATMLGYKNAFLMYTIACLIAIPLCVISARPRKA
jgi:MFS transporter, DHA2 family, multidrug resistance protein